MRRIFESSFLPVFGLIITLLSLIGPALAHSLCHLVATIYVDCRVELPLLIIRSLHKIVLFLGFGILMFGMQNMSNAMKNVPEEFLKDIFLTFSNNPILGRITGAI